VVPRTRKTPPAANYHLFCAERLSSGFSRLGELDFCGLHAACPLLSSALVSKKALSPSFSETPECASAEAWTKTSFSPLSGEMKPKWRVGIEKFFTVPGSPQGQAHR